METAPGINQGKPGPLSPFRGRRRGVSEIIATLMLVAVTVVGGVLAMTLVGTITDEAGAFGNIKAKQELRLIGYDSRDNEHLTDIDDIHNEKDSPTPFLCTTSCDADPDFTPENGGTEFIVIYLHNAGLDDVFLDDLLVSTDNVLHEWDGDTAGEGLTDASNDLDADHSYPHSGMYSIVDEDGDGTSEDLEQHDDTVINGGEVVRVVIKLSSEISDDINIDDTVPIIVTTADGSVFKFTIHGGSVQ